MPISLWLPAFEGESLHLAKQLYFERYPVEKDSFLFALSSKFLFVKKLSQINQELSGPSLKILFV